MLSGNLVGGNVQGIENGMWVDSVPATRLPHEWDEIYEVPFEMLVGAPTPARVSGNATAACEDD